MTGQVNTDASGRAVKRKHGALEDEGNIFDVSAAASAALNSARSSSRVIGVLNKGLRHSTDGGAPSTTDWDDADGYYLATIGELMGDRYMVVETSCGKGAYSSIVKAKAVSVIDDGSLLVAIKIVRANAAMLKAAEKEIEVIEKLQMAGGESKRHIVRMLSAFYYRGHQCLVFELMWDDLREALRKLTKGKGMTLSAVRTYTQQLMLGLHHIHRCGVLHLDIKPDNILLSGDQSTVKLCDFGAATEVDDVQISPYVMSRCYRAPEIIIGCKPTLSVDIFALGCTLYELFTGKVLLSGKGNHDQLRKTMEFKGKIPSSVIKKGTFWTRHFDDNCILKPDSEADPRHADPAELEGGLRLKIGRLKAQLQVYPCKSIRDLVFDRVGQQRCKSSSPEDLKYVLRAERFSNFLEDMLCLDPDKRFTPKDALKDPFLS